ncbi:MAG: IreB family regulatory phosphoprotein [Erysipelotrichaceae bacterium]
MSNKIDQTVSFEASDIKSEIIKEILKQTKEAIEERGYKAVNQISGYLISNDPAYISSYKGARTNIQKVERYEIIEELVRSYLDIK